MCVPVGSPHSCRVLAIRPVADHPQVISTSRHVTQGIIDLSEEKWDPAAQTLSGVSRVVANDPYELRIVVPAGPKVWRATSAGDEKFAITQDGSNIRATLTSRESREVHWQLKFTQTAVSSPAPKA